jgi:EAL domain-containing protein (putative c-di-GMP-specific phosphodiesterase class I)
MVVLCLATIAATLAAVRLWGPARREPFLLFAAGEAVGFAAGASAHHLLRGDLAANVSAALRDSRLPPDCLALEITESVLMHDLEVAIVRLHELKALGVHLAIDDFGTGYSSLAYLRQMPIDTVKIDKSFVDGVAGGAEESAVARAIIALAGTLHLDTVAEGVEHAEQAAALAGLGCHLAQGYHFSRPVPPPTWPA